MYMNFEQVNCLRVSDRSITRPEEQSLKNIYIRSFRTTAFTCQVFIFQHRPFQTIPGRLLFKLLSLECPQKETSMNSNSKIQTKLKTTIQAAIWQTLNADGGGRTCVKNTDVVEALLEVVGVWSAIHGFETYSRTDLAFKHAMTIKGHIEKYEPIMKSGKMPFDIIPRIKAN
jgi:hypothetical protein